MLDLKFIIDNIDLVKAGVAQKHEHADIDRIVEIDRCRREITRTVEAKKAERNQVSGQIAVLKKSGQDVYSMIAAMKALGDEIAALDERLREVEGELGKLLLTVPNLPDPSTPPGETEDDNVEIRSWGNLPKFDFPPAPHWELGEKLRLFDLPSGAKLSGSGFILFTGMGARLQRALINFMIDLHVKKHGYVEVLPPFMVTRQTMIGTGQLPKLEDDMYSLEAGEMFMIPTGEVPVTNIHAGEILKDEDLPKYYVAYTPCFRRESGAHGKDTRGLIRVHQFDKVELVKLVRQENSLRELEALVKDAEEVLQALNLPYRVKALCAADLSFASAKCYDLEVYAAGVDKFLEVSSCSTFGDFQARRMMTRYRPPDGGKPKFSHTLNGSGLALPRTVIALLENNQTSRGTVIIPEALRPYLDGIKELC